ncbi:MAG: hypothetical protein PHU71_00450 [Candidatus Gracilibacteria bacterium]|nr:hypothetical protein [Candidatus Gracilibacteria bacterium]
MLLSPLIFKIIGALGLLCITWGILFKSSKKEAVVSALLGRSNKKQLLLYILGGSLLEIYSIYIGDWVFIILQAVFVAAAVWELAKNSK